MQCNNGTHFKRRPLKKDFTETENSSASTCCQMTKIMTLSDDGDGSYLNVMNVIFLLKKIVSHQKSSPWGSGVAKTWLCGC